jgi:hypothetical protein
LVHLVPDEPPEAAGETIRMRAGVSEVQRCRDANARRDCGEVASGLGCLEGPSTATLDDLP